MTLINALPAGTAALGDVLPGDDVDDSNNTKKYTFQEVIELYNALTATLTNKTIDANGTGNSISNIDVADLADGTDGELITWSAAGAPTTVAVGTSGQVLTSNGAGAAPSFQASAGGDDTAILVAPGGYGTTLSTTPRAIYNYDLVSPDAVIGAITVVRAGTLRNLYVETLNNARTGSVLVEVYKNNTATGLSVTVAATTDGTFSDTSTTVSVAAGDYVSFKLSDVAGGATGAFICDRPSCEVLYD
jgi:hypothetical protein